MKKMTDQIAALHYQIIQGLLRNSRCPSNSELAITLGVGQSDVESLLGELAAIHGLVLHPHVCEPWIVHPFSLTPALNWIDGANGSWWAPCIWCAFGVATLAGGPVRIHSRLGAESDTLIIEVVDGAPRTGEDLVVHFAIPPARAWDNVHQHCSLVLPFRSTADIQSWCKRYSVKMGEPVPLMQVAALASVWYGSHANRDWHKWTVPEAQAIFARVGLISEFWNLGSASREF